MKLVEKTSLVLSGFYSYSFGSTLFKSVCFISTWLLMRINDIYKLKATLLVTYILFFDKLNRTFVLFKNMG